MNLNEDGIYLDCTVGGGGHLLAMLQNTTKARFIGIDLDPEAINYTRSVVSPYKDRVLLYEENFVNIDSILNRMKINKIDGILFDLGVSYHQLITPERGFSFNNEGPLLMRMSPYTTPLIAKLRNTTELEIAKILREYGNVRNASKIAELIFENRKIIETTIELRSLLERIIPKKVLIKNLHKIFQAFRIWVNDELNNLRSGLKKAIYFLKNHGRVIVISYHSGEDRIVKQMFLDYEKKGLLKRLNKKVIKPTAWEIEKNPSAKSARMRVGEKCA